MPGLKNEFRVVLGGQPTPGFFFSQQNSRKACFYPAGRTRYRDCAKHVWLGRREIRFNLFGALFSKLLVPTCFAIPGYPWQWVETNWRWLATQDHVKLVYNSSIDEFHGLRWPANAILFLTIFKGHQKFQNTSTPTASNIAHQNKFKAGPPWGYFSHLWS